MWCQLFSEPGAGSDAAGVRTRATKVDGGWMVNGQKVWTTGAAQCNRGFATVRTDPDKPKHDGITMMVIDLHAPGVDIRPLREATGARAVQRGVLRRRVRVRRGRRRPGQRRLAGGALDARQRAREHRRRRRRDRRPDVRPARPRAPLRRATTPSALEPVGRLLSERAQHAPAQPAHRRARRRRRRARPRGQRGQAAERASTASAQAALALRIIGPAGALAEGPDAGVQATEIFARCLTIAGGTSEIVRSQIGERLLGLPRDPLLR